MKTFDWQCISARINHELWLWRCLGSPRRTTLKQICAQVHRGSDQHAASPRVCKGLLMEDQPASVPSLALSARRGHQFVALTNTYSARLPFVVFMLLKYAALWPSHPFTFYVPYNHDADIEAPIWAAPRQIYADRLVPVKTASAMNETWRSLLDACCQADALVFWAPDDYYPLHLDAAGLDRVVNYVATQADLYGFSLAYTDGVWGSRASERVIEYAGLCPH